MKVSFGYNSRIKILVVMFSRIALLGSLVVGYQNCTASRMGGVLTTSVALASTALTAGSNNGMQFVSIGGSDANDGSSMGTAKATISAAYSSLPPCTIANSWYNSYSSKTWAHCGQITVAAGTYNVSSTINISSPFIKIQGPNAGSAVINYTGSSGAAIYWTANPFGAEFEGSGGLYDIRIDGANAGAGTYGLQTNDISGFHAKRVIIQNFTGPGSVGWEDSTISWYNEKYDVEMSLENNSVNWRINPLPSSPGYPSTTFGYGVFNMHIEDWGGQVGFQMLNGDFSFSMFHATFNQPATPANADAIQIYNNAVFSSNTYAIEIESPMGVGNGHHEINITSSNPVPFSGVGTISQGAPQSNLWTGGGGHNLPPGWHQFWPQFTTVDSNMNSPNVLFRLNPCPVTNVLGAGLSGCNIIDVSAIPSPSYIQTIWPSHSGTLALSGANGTSAGTIALVNGSGGHGFTTPYSGNPPICTATDTTAPRAVQIFNVSQSQFQVVGTGSDVLNWICTPATN